MQMITLSQINYYFKSVQLFENKCSICYIYFLKTIILGTE